MRWARLRGARYFAAFRTAATRGAALVAGGSADPKGWGRAPLVQAGLGFVPLPCANFFLPAAS